MASDYDAALNALESDPEVIAKRISATAVDGAVRAERSLPDEVDLERAAELARVTASRETV